MSKRLSVSFIAILLVCFNLLAQEVPFSWISNDTLVINDGVSKQHYLIRDGLLTLVSSTSLTSDWVEIFHSTQPDRTAKGKPRETYREISRHEQTERTAAYFQLNLHAIYENYETIRTLRKYDSVPGIEWGLLVKGDTEMFESSGAEGAGLIEDPDLLTGSNPHYYFLPFSMPHYSTTIISMREATDHHTNTVYRRDATPYRKSNYFRGSILLAKNNNTGVTHLVAKKSPIERAQSNYAGFDFSTDFTGVKVHSPGLTSLSIARMGFDKEANGTKDEGHWQEAYSIFVMINAENENEALKSYKAHELAVHRYLPERDNTFTMNTWGDRNRDSRVNEQFILNELGVAARLGVTHYQIDDGWQQGLSRNSAAKAGLLWDDWDAADWEVNLSRFPNGLGKVKEEAGRLGMDLGLWFNPSKSNDYSLWKRDQEILLSLHKRYGISWIKIDGLEIGNKLSETRVAQMLGGATEKSDGNLQFNMDVTAGYRGGYLYFNHFGNIFLENRYTDWGNYYPHLTLRNAWMLARYVPIQRFQIEWLNKWRNDNQYPTDDPLKPLNVPFDYQFAVAMIGQPLAWMEATGLPEEAFEVVPLVEAWKKVRGEMQRGVISPVGDEPNGFGFPGFISQGENRLFVLLFRENTAPSIGLASTVYQLPHDSVAGRRFVRLAGEGVLMNSDDDRLEVKYKKPFQFLFGYFE